MKRIGLVGLWVWAVLGTAGAWGQEREITVELPGGVPLEMVWIEPGTFLMGVPLTEEEVRFIETPQHQVTLTEGFYIGKFELTQAQWTAVMGTKPWEERGEDACLNCPATQVSWDDTQVFFQTLNEQSDRLLSYRLPTEAEWEYAARAGTTTAWSFGNNSLDLEKYAWYIGNTCDAGACFLHEVGLKLPNPWGLYDVYGNVFEWVEDWWFREYTEEPQINPIRDEIPVYDNPDISPERGMKGGSAAVFASDTRSGVRGAWPPNLGSSDIGFRVAGSLIIETKISPTSWGTLKTISQPYTRRVK